MHVEGYYDETVLFHASSLGHFRGQILTQQLLEEVSPHDSSGQGRQIFSVLRLQLVLLALGKLHAGQQLGLN